MINRILSKFFKKPVLQMTALKNEKLYTGKNIYIYVFNNRLVTRIYRQLNKNLIQWNGQKFEQILHQGRYIKS